MRSPRALIPTTLLLLTLPAGRVGAQEQQPPTPPRPQSARLLLPACESVAFDHATLTRALRIELLGNEVVLGTGTPSSEIPSPTIIIGIDISDCAVARVEVFIRNPATGRSVQDRVDLTDTPGPDRDRILAIAIAELIERAWPELAAPRAPPPPPTEGSEASDTEPADGEPPRVGPLDGEAESDLSVEPPVREADLERFGMEAERRAVEATAEHHREAMNRRPTTLLGLRLGVHAYPSFAGAVFGGALTLDFRLSRRAPLRLEVGLGYGFGGATDELGVIETHVSGGDVALLVSGGGERVQADAGLRLDLAWVRAVGQPADQSVVGATLDGVMFSVAAAVNLRVRVHPRVWIIATSSAGYVVVGLEALVEGRRVGGIGGPVIGVEAGACLAF